MLIIGLAGPAQVGKNEISRYLAQRYGFVPCAFSDALYDEVQRAYGLETDEMLRDPAVKENVSKRLALHNCKDSEFQTIGSAKVNEMARLRGGSLLYPETEFALSPRQVLQWWGTDYRRAQDPDYWVKRLAHFLGTVHFSMQYPEHRPQRFVVDGVRFENERALIHKMHGNLWHIWRDEAPQKPTGHVSEALLPLAGPERQFWNNGSLEDMQRGIDMMFTSQHPYIRVEPATIAAPPHDCAFVIPIAVDGKVLGHRCPTCNRDTLKDDVTTDE